MMPRIVVSTPAAGWHGRFLDDAARYVAEETDEVVLSGDDVDDLAWVGEMYSRVAHGDVDGAIDLLFAAIDDILLVGDFARCDDILRAIDLQRLDTNLLVGVLSITVAAKDHLRTRARLVERVEARLRTLAPERADRLLDGLR